MKGWTRSPAYFRSQQEQLRIMSVSGTNLVSSSIRKDNWNGYCDRRPSASWGLFSALRGHFAARISLSPFAKAPRISSGSPEKEHCHQVGIFLSRDPLQGRFLPRGGIPGGESPTTGTRARRGVFLSAILALTTTCNAPNGEDLLT